MTPELCVPFLGGRLYISPFAYLTPALMFFIEGWTSFAVIVLAAVIHELGHTAAIYLCGSRVRYVMLRASGAVIVYDDNVTTYGDELAIALAGPAANLLFFVFSLIGCAVHLCVEGLLFTLACLFFGVFNLLPVRGNDGANALRIICEKRRGVEAAQNAEKTAALISSAAAATAAFAIYELTGRVPAAAVMLILALVP